MLSWKKRQEVMGAWGSVLDGSSRWSWGWLGESGLEFWQKRKMVCARAPGELAEEAWLLVQLIEVISAATFWIEVRLSLFQPQITSLPPATFHCTEAEL